MQLYLYTTATILIYIYKNKLNRSKKCLVASPSNFLLCFCFRFRWKLVTTPAWFGSKRHGVEIGLANVLTQDIADISGSSGLMTPGRAEVFDFGVGTYLFR